METLVLSHHRNNHHQCYSRNRGHGSSKAGFFGSPPSANFRAFNCRSFDSGEGLLPIPFDAWSNSTPVTRRECLTPRSTSKTSSGSRKGAKRISKSLSVPVPLKIKFENLREELFFSERWAGPAYSNSPPPSSLPLPKFSLQPKKSASPAVPSLISGMAKSAPTSPVRERSPSSISAFNFSDSATMTLRRILNLDIADSARCV